MQSGNAKNRLMIAAAGSGKTTYLVKEALRLQGQVLITTFTQANETEIRNKIIEINRFIPSNITVQTFFSFLLQHGVRPFQGELYKTDIRGMLLMNGQSGIKFRSAKGFNVVYSEDEFDKHYFSKGGRIYSDKIAKFVLRADVKSDGKVINRLCRIFKHILIDEIQDMAGYDLEIIKLLFASPSSVLLVGDPRQVTYLTHHDKLHSGYKDGKIEDFILDKCKKLKCAVDKGTLNVSHRNNTAICSFSSRLYPQYPAALPCTCEKCRAITTSHEGIFAVKTSDVDLYREKYTPVVLRYSGASEFEWNFGASKGLGFKRVLIYPTKPIEAYLRNGRLYKTISGKMKECFDIAKFYVALTRAQYSVAIVTDFTDSEQLIDGTIKYEFLATK